MQNEETKPIIISDELWDRVAPLISWNKRVRRKRGRPRSDPRSILEGIFFILYTGCQWKHLPRCYPPPSTVHDAFQELVGQDFFRILFEYLGIELIEAGILDTEECYIDGMFIRAVRGGEGVGIGKKGKGSKLMAIVEKNGLPISISVDSASHHEVTRVEEVLEEIIGEELPEHLIGDAAYDSDPLDQKLEKIGVELIAPHKKNRVAARTQDGRPFRRYKRRYKIERFNSWIQNFRRVLVRHEYKLQNYLAMVYLGCSLILFRKMTASPAF